ncbi:hypothetical protein HOY80DRAFT_969565 [Tuber brumale]|nr:hypothetical protein HOY80DRAFT_969565 [Tuber brumale]
MISYKYLVVRVSNGRVRLAFFFSLETACLLACSRQLTLFFSPPISPLDMMAFSGKAIGGSPRGLRMIRHAESLLMQRLQASPRPARRGAPVRSPGVCGGWVDGNLVERGTVMLFVPPVIVACLVGWLVSRYDIYYWIICYSWMIYFFIMYAPAPTLP